MLAIAILSLFGSAAIAYLIGYAYVAPRDAFLRTKWGIWLLIAGGLSFIFLPPQLTAMDSLTGSTSAQLGSMANMFAWPSTISKGVYIGLWIVTTLIGLLAGLRIWKAGQPDWRASGGSNAWDSSAAGRVRALLPMADSLDEALDVIARQNPDARSLERVAEDLRHIGTRFVADLPAGTGAVYGMVTAKLPPALAQVVTGFLLEGAGRGGEIARVR
ncbi:MAG: hypothetical protein Q8K99_10695 [Actinomycetota bacterium]|nr:hypothetical protein [Actinomycetota bacterium]